MFLFDVNNLLTIRDRYWQKSESAFHFCLSRAYAFYLSCLFWMGACKQDDVVVVIKMGALFMDAYSETNHMLLSLFARHQILSPRVLGDY